MPAYYFDTSALIKRYIDEKGSAWARTTIANAGQYRYIAQITGVEMVSAITRLAAGKNITDPTRVASLSAFKRDFAQGYIVVSVNTPVIQSAMTLAERHVIRGYDAVQLASALWVRDRVNKLQLDFIFVGADDKLNKAAVAEGLAVENPNDHA